MCVSVSGLYAGHWVLCFCDMLHTKRKSGLGVDVGGEGRLHLPAPLAQEKVPDVRYFNLRRSRARQSVCVVCMCCV